MAYPKVFVSIPTDNPKGQPRSYLVAPVYHDGKSDDDLISGEVLISMTALTPFLPANDEVAFAQCAGIIQNREGALVPPASWKFKTTDGKDFAIEADKKVVEPLRMGPSDGRVVVPGARFKGFVGLSIGALFAASFSRVAERTYSFRPNAVFPRGAKRKREPRPAIVEGETPEGGLRIRILPFDATGRIVFVRRQAKDKIDLTPAARQAATVKGVRVEFRKDRPNRLFSDAGSTENLSGYMHFPYFGGVDGEGHMARLFAQQMGNNSADVYHHVLVEDCDLTGQSLTVPKPVLDQHQRTLEHLSNRDEGHLRREHPLTHGPQKADFEAHLPEIRQGIASAATAIRTPNQLIYVEVELNRSGSITGVNSIGANYYYLWRSLDSVRKVWNGSELVDRPTTIPRPEERSEDQDEDQLHSPPRMLTMGRALSGYVRDDRNPGMTGIGKGDFAQMTGRFGFNNALERLEAGVNGEANNRFLMSDAECIVPLRVLGAPRPSAAEHYIQQPDIGLRKGYGESPHEPGGDLGGYAFYSHQPDAATDPLVYAFPRHEAENIKSKQSSLARFVSVPGAVFRVRMRFANLRRWELAALLACLRPGLLAEPEGHPFAAEPGTTAPRHAIKLGRGRPLGLGSLDVSIDRVILRDGTVLEHAELRDQLAALRRLLVGAGLQQTMTDWLAVHQYAGKTRASYPMAAKGQNEKTIVAHYSEQTKQFLRARRAW